MTWITVVGSTFYYIALPVTTILTLLYGWLIIAFAPVLHLAAYTISALFLPLRVLAKFETLYIYLGVAAFIGLITGAILHLSSTILVSVFDLTSTADDKCTSASPQAVREHKALEEAWQSSSSRGGGSRLEHESSLEKRYAEWQDRDVGTRRENGLTGQTILEEDDSEDS